MIYRERVPSSHSACKISDPGHFTNNTIEHWFVQPIRRLLSLACLNCTRADCVVFWLQCSWRSESRIILETIIVIPPEPFQKRPRWSVPRRDPNSELFFHIVASDPTRSFSDPKFFYQIIRLVIWISLLINNVSLMSDTGSVLSQVGGKHNAPVNQW